METFAREKKEIMIISPSAYENVLPDDYTFHWAFEEKDQKLYDGLIELSELLFDDDHMRRNYAWSVIGLYIGQMGNCQLAYVFKQRINNHLKREAARRNGHAALS